VCLDRAGAKAENLGGPGLAEVGHLAQPQRLPLPLRQLADHLLQFDRGLIGRVRAVRAVDDHGVDVANSWMPWDSSHP
jgi:hypothetical protein